MISDIYLMCASFSPIASDKMKEAFERDWNGKSFADQWLEDDEVIKGALKKEIRNLHKIWALGLSYSMGPQKLQLSAFENGYDLPLKITKDFFKAYWRAFGKVKALGDMLQAKYLRQGYLSTTFGYRLYPDKDYKCLNYFIQSTVSGIMHWLNWRFFQKQHEAKFITVIHDEVILEIPYNQVEEVRRIWEETVEELNTALGWTVKIRTGWKVGANLYEAK
jgi:DNA polymerase I-like protein with 3'-5' exonuclease and polymerase domains